MHATFRHAVDWFFKDKNNKFVLAQMPNIPLLGWFLFMLSIHAVADQVLKTGLGFVSSAFLFTWAYLEITDGSSRARRVLGLIIMVSVVITRFS